MDEDDGQKLVNRYVQLVAKLQSVEMLLWVVRKSIARFQRDADDPVDAAAQQFHGADDDGTEHAAQGAYHQHCFCGGGDFCHDSSQPDATAFKCG